MQSRCHSGHRASHISSDYFWHSQIQRPLAQQSRCASFDCLWSVVVPVMQTALDATEYVALIYLAGMLRDARNGRVASALVCQRHFDLRAELPKQHLFDHQSLPCCSGTSEGGMWKCLTASWASSAKAGAEVWLA